MGMGGRRKYAKVIIIMDPSRVGNSFIEYIYNLLKKETRHRFVVR